MRGVYLPYPVVKFRLATAADKPRSTLGSIFSSLSKRSIILLRKQRTEILLQGIRTRNYTLYLTLLAWSKSEERGKLIIYAFAAVVSFVSLVSLL